MTLEEIKSRVMFQTNNDDEDVGDYMPHLVDYINDGYDRLLDAWAGEHINTAGYPALVDDDPSPSPAVPDWIHPYLADWATWLVYRNGNPNKQQRGYAFRSSFDEMLAKVRNEGGLNGLNSDGTLKKYKYFRNIPR